MGLLHSQVHLFPGWAISPLSAASLLYVGIEGCCQMKSTIDQINCPLLTFDPSCTMKTTKCAVHTRLILFKYEQMAKTVRMCTYCGWTFFLFFPRSHFFILRSRYLGTGSHKYYSWVSLREKWMIASFLVVGVRKSLCDVTWLQLLCYQGFCFDSISMLTRWHHLASHTLTAFWLLCKSTASPSFLPLLDCTLIIFSLCLFLLSTVWLHWLFIMLHIITHGKVTDTTYDCICNLASAKELSL